MINAEGLFIVNPARGGSGPHACYYTRQQTISLNVHAFTRGYVQLAQEDPTVSRETGRGERCGEKEIL